MLEGNPGVVLKTEGMHLVCYFPCLRFEHISSNISAMLWLDVTFLLDFLWKKLDLLLFFSLGFVIWGWLLPGALCDEGEREKFMTAFVGMAGKAELSKTASEWGSDEVRGGKSNEKML